MKNTKVMLAAIATFLLTWLSLGTIGYLLSDCYFEYCMTHPATLMIMLVFGWIPSVVVADDLKGGE
jgi:hypothetical protein